MKKTYIAPQIKEVSISTELMNVIATSYGGEKNDSWKVQAKFDEEDDEFRFDYGW